MSWTLDGPAGRESVVKGSVFRARAAPVSSAEEALAFLAEVRVAEATHNCWAFRIGQNFRASDDGEPGGTAGRPILSAIEGQDVDGVMVVVTRWFGGVKLGGGGLVRAYGGAAAACLREAAKTLYVPRSWWRFHCPFSLHGEVSARLGQWQVEVADCTFGASGAEMLLGVPLECTEELSAWLRDLTRGQQQLRAVEKA
ncbi:IMPACT family protein [Oecophyllibacter saccharovorans]|uniref:DUF1949 domain-containing protein n=1 Tax=Oecophyllibacter saccharovorans TaxID=2558360 RepID=A0A506UKT8_9PROT|nr:YigZ family protein [Oecophyllibacter saccharovorans]TPW33935.1 DUF1949 domain-containing protein [Oecophyllibacter saccharovorans]